MTQRQAKRCHLREGSDSDLDRYVRYYLTNFVLNNRGIISEIHISRATGTVN